MASEFRQALENLKPKMVMQAQMVYDIWKDTDGLCYEIANKLANLITYTLSGKFPEITATAITHKGKWAQFHFWVRAGIPGTSDWYDIDIPFGHYETCVGNDHFEKIPNKVFGERDIYIYKTSPQFDKAPWELRKTYKPTSTDKYFQETYD